MATSHIALTGGIGSGKSTVSSMFRSLGVPVFDLDAICHHLLASSAEIKAAIVEQFGSQILAPSGAVDRARLGKFVFGNRDGKDRLEAILHPLAAEFVALHLRSITAQYVMSDIPLLRSKDGYHRVLLVVTKERVRFARVQQRDGRSIEQVRAIAEAQPLQDELLTLADEVIHNDGDMASLRQQVAQTHELYRSLR